MATLGVGVAAAQQPDAKATYDRMCAACHGALGAADGPVSSAMRPKPPNFTDSTFQASRADSQLTAAITKGKPPMPAFGQLSAAEVQALVQYVRQLGGRRP